MIMRASVYKSDEKRETHFWQNLLSDKTETPPKREDFLKKALRECQTAMNDAYQGLQNTNEPDLIDRYIYELNAANMRYKVLLRDIKEIAPSEYEAGALTAKKLSASQTTPPIPAQTAMRTSPY